MCISGLGAGIAVTWGQQTLDELIIFYYGSNFRYITDALKFWAYVMYLELPNIIRINQGCLALRDRRSNLLIYDVRCF